jgi:hypothetical protein
MISRRETEAGHVMRTSDRVQGLMSPTAEPGSRALLGVEFWAGRIPVSGGELSTRVTGQCGASRRTSSRYVSGLSWCKRQDAISERKVVYQRILRVHRLRVVAGRDFALHVSCQVAEDCGEPGAGVCIGIVTGDIEQVVDQAVRTTSRIRSSEFGL